MDDVLVQLSQDYGRIEAAPENALWQYSILTDGYTLTRQWREAGIQRIDNDVQFTKVSNTHQTTIIDTMNIKREKVWHPSARKTTGPVHVDSSFQARAPEYVDTVNKKSK